MAAGATEKVKQTVSYAYNHALDPVKFALSLPKCAAEFMFHLWYLFCQEITIRVFKPHPPRSSEQVTESPRGRIAVIGAGLTGISSAAHAIAHGFDVVIFEQSDKIGGIWVNVNASSGLQLNSLLYRFFPGVRWSHAFPHRDEILGEIRRVWREYRLASRTRFDTKVASVRRARREEISILQDEDDLIPDKQGHARWIVNDGEEGVFDAVIVTIGTCGEPNMITLPGMPGYREKEESEEEEKKKDRPEKRRGKGAGKQTVGKNEENEFQGDGDAKRQDGDSSSDILTQDNVWGKTKPCENAQDVNRDQIEKKEQGFPAPGEAFQPGPDLQEGSEEKSFVPQNHGNEDEGRNDDEAEENGAPEGNEGSGEFTGPIIHSSQLDAEGAPSFEGKIVAVIGGGASAVEAVEAALAHGAKNCVMLVRDDKWIIPRNIFIDTLIALQPFGREMPLSFLWEKFITYFNYYFVTDLTPAHLGLFEGTPVVNGEFLGHVRNGRCKYIRCDPERLTPHGVLVNERGRNSKPGDEGEEKEFEADIVVLATGFKKPDVGFLEDDLFPEDYDRPNLYLQAFSTEDWSILMTNSAYMNAIGTVGHFHIGIYTRILLTFLMDRNARPTPKDMKLWVDGVCFLKRGAKGGALGFFTYMELMIWLFLFHIFRLDRLKWLFFIMQGWGVPSKA